MTTQADVFVSRLQPSQARDPLPPAFLLALGLHLAVLLTLPYLNYRPSPLPQRIDIELTQAQAQPEAKQPEPTPPQPKPQSVTPKVIAQPQQQALPLLTARADTPDTPTVLDIPATPPPATVNPSAPANLQPESAPAPAATPPSSGSNAARGEAADTSEAWEGYGQMLYDMVSKNKNYPQIAIRRHWQGQAKISVRFDNGKLVELILVEPGSGHEALDNAALDMLKKAVNALPIKGNLARKSFTVIVPVDFRIEG